MTLSQQASWETSTYVVATTRVFVIFGMTYLVKSSYQLYQRLRSSNSSDSIQNRGESHSSSPHMMCRPSADGTQ